MTGAGIACTLPGRHRSPAPLTVEAHHIIPVAWQQFWKPTVEPYPGTDPNGRGHLWDVRTIAVCPTHHRNVHALIVALMRQAAALKQDAVPVLKVSRANRSELAVAMTGLSRFKGAGGSLLALTAAHEWGMA